MATGLGTNELNEANVIRFDVLPDDVLLDIFDLYVDHETTSYGKKVVESWQTLVHVCRRWRSLVFRSPRRLNLRLFCTPKTRTRNSDKLDIWPVLPLVVRGDTTSHSGTDNIIAALGHSNRVCQVHLTLLGQKVEQVLAMMRVPFPELTYLELSLLRGASQDIPDSFLGGSAPSLRCLDLKWIAFPGLPNLLLSATHLVKLCLTYIPHSWYISPEAIVAPLSTLPNLETLSLDFSPRPRFDWETGPLHLSKRSILPALENFQFKGVIEYLEVLVTLIDTPQLNYLEIMLLNELADIRRLAYFINHIPKLSEHDDAHVEFNPWDTRILFGTQISIAYSNPDWQLSSFSQIGSFSITSTVKNLSIELGVQDEHPEDDAIESTLWLQLLGSFTAVKNLYLHKEFAPGIAAALKELVGGRITEVLPSLQNIFVEEVDSFEKHWATFVVARQLSGHPVVITDWYRSSDSDISDEHSD